MSRKGRNLLLALLGAAHSLNHSIFLVLPLYLSGVADEFGVSLDVIGFAATVSAFLYGAGALVGGPLSDRIGELKTLAVSLALSGISTLIFLVVQDIVGFNVALILMGASASLYHPTANSLISKVFHRDMAEAMGIHGTGGNVGFMFAPIIAVALGAVGGWRASFAFFGLLSLLVSILLLKMSPIGVDRTTAKTSGIRDVIKIPGLWAFLIYNIGVGLYQKGIEFIFPTFLEERRAFSKWLAGSTVSCILAIGILGQWLGGKTSDFFGSKRVLIATSTGISLSLLLLLMIPQPVISVSAFVILYGICLYGNQPSTSSLAGLITPEDKRGAVYGLLFFCAFGLGSVSQAIATHCVTRFNLESALYAMAAFSVMALSLSFLVPGQNRRSHKQSK